MPKKRRGQFQILAAFLVISILSAAVMTSYYRTQENSRVEPVTIANTVREVNSALYKLLGFATGYYSSLIKVTGDYDYAQTETITYLDGGLKNIAQSHPDWGVSFNYTPSELTIDSDWFDKTSFTKGEWSISYSLPTLGLAGIKLKTVAECSVSINATEERVEPITGTKTYWSHVNVTMDNYPNLQLSQKNFQFFKYDSVKRSWQSISLISEPVLTTNGLYQIQIPPTIDPEVYYIQVEDQRGITSQSGFIQGTPIAGGWSNKSEMSYTYKIDWGTTNPFGGINDLFTLELLQNGTIRWLGHRLPVKTNSTLKAEKPIPPLPVKSLRVSKSTDKGATWFETPFQIEDWASNYTVPQGITNSKAIFNENCMIVFQVDHTYTHVKIWWDGKSSATPSTQTSPFIDNPASHTLNNGKILMNTDLPYGGKTEIKTSIPPSGGASASVTATFFRFNVNKLPVYGSDLSFVITNGIVRDIIQQEPEFSGGIPGTSDTLTHIVITLPAGTTYYTYKLRALFLGTTQPRTLTELNVLSIDPWTSVDTYTKKTENGVDDSNNPITPLPAPSLANYYGRNDGAGVHRWSELIDSNNRGAGILMHNSALGKLYEFDYDAPIAYRSYIWNDGTKIEINPVRNGVSATFLTRTDITLNGAVVLFDGTSSTSPIFNRSTDTQGLSLMVDKPPSFFISLGS